MPRTRLRAVLPLLSVLAAMLVTGLAGCREPSASVPPNVVMIVVDTLRADRLSCYGYERPTSPRIDALAAQGIRFERASSTSSWTVPAHASLFTGLYPIAHGATQESASLPGQAPTLAEVLHVQGYATLGVSANPIVSSKLGFARGFERFAETFRERYEVTDGSGRHRNQVVAEEFLADVPPGRPFFLFVNYIEPHGPYDPPEPYRSQFVQKGTPADLVARATRRRAPSHYLDPDAISDAEFEALGDLYDGEIATVDRYVGELLDALRASGRLADTLVILTSDHGENLGDHGHFRHMFSLYRSTVHVPLIVVLPDGRSAGTVRTDLVSLRDLFATVLETAGVVRPAGLTQGRDILAPPAENADAIVFAEYYFPVQALGVFKRLSNPTKNPKLSPYLRRLRSVEAERLRLVSSSTDDPELFDVVADPREEIDLAGSTALAEQEDALRAALAAFVEAAGGEPPLSPSAEAFAPDGRTPFGALDREAEDELRALGYVE